MKRQSMGLLVAALTLVFAGGSLRTVRAESAQGDHSAQTADPYLVIQLVNQLRAEYGLPPYQINPTLMQVAQAHSDYQASIGQITHFGANGSRPRDRLAAAGYAPVGGFFVHENIYGGWTGTPYDAVEWWRNSPLHFQGMTSTRYVETGAGIGVGADGSLYYTILFAYRVGQSSGGSGSSEAPAPSAATAPPALPYEPVEAATRAPDGSIMHEVQEGQNFSDIAEVYDIDLYEMLAINGLEADDIIYPGDRLMIEPPYTPTASPTATATSTARPTRAATEGADETEGRLPTGESPYTPTATASVEMQPVGDAATMAAEAAARANSTAVAEVEAARATAQEDPVEEPEAVVEQVRDASQRGVVIMAVMGVLGLALIGFGVTSLRRRT